MSGTAALQTHKELLWKPPTQLVTVGSTDTSRSSIQDPEYGGDERSAQCRVDAPIDACEY